jgi:hypothetical protein
LIELYEFIFELWGRFKIMIKEPTVVCIWIFTAVTYAKGNEKKYDCSGEESHRLPW